MVIICLMTATACRRARTASTKEAEPPLRGEATAPRADSEDSDVPPYAGHGPNGVPHYARRHFSQTERALLRTKYGVTDPNRLYVSDSSEDGLLKYDTRPKECATCYVNSYRLGFVSVRRPEESWEAVERRVRATPLSQFPPWARHPSVSLADLDPSVRTDAEQMLAEARRFGYPLRVIATYRSPEREAYLMAKGRARTHTLTSMHSYGRALDIVVGDGNLSHAATRSRWIEFRRWVSGYRNGEFHIIGTPEQTWDWAHVEIPTPDLGFRSIEAALARARVCDPHGGTMACTFPPHLPPSRPSQPGTNSREVPRVISLWNDQRHSDGSVIPPAGGQSRDTPRKRSRTPPQTHAHWRLEPRSE
jgi:hypothetical protein